MTSATTPRHGVTFDRKVDYMATNYRLSNGKNVVQAALQLDKLSRVPAPQTSPRRRKTAARAHRQRGALSTAPDPARDTTLNHEHSRSPETKESGYIRFRRAARAVRMIIQVCRVCREFLMASVKQEEWYRMLDKLLGSHTADVVSSPKKSHAFVTFITDDEKCMKELCFDANEYSRAYNSQRLLTNEIKEILRLPPGSRSSEQVGELVICLKRLSEPFCALPLDVQKRLCQLGIYNSYYPSRVIVRQGLPADGVYFVLTGTLASKASDQKVPLELGSGDKFGEEELLTGCLRRSTVLTRSKTDLFYIHRFDYREVFFMASDSYDPTQLNICRNDVIFRNFPMHRLTENPSVWAILTYKTGKLMVKDSNELEWIYVIKSGEARVIKYLEINKVDYHNTRKRLQTALQSTSSYYRRKDLLDFVSDKHCLKSHYKPAKYKPSTRCAASAPAGTSHHRRRFNDIVFRTLPCTPLTAHASDTMTRDGLDARRTDDDVIRKHFSSDKNGESFKKLVTFKQSRKPSLSPNEIKTPRPKTATRHRAASAAPCTSAPVQIRVTADGDGSVAAPEQDDSASCASSRRSFIQTATNSTSSAGAPPGGEGFAGGRLKPDHINVPPFVQIDTLHAGQAFGFRACLDTQERGPSVSLVSNGCEAMQINKKFFMKFMDDSLMSLIRVQYKPFPSQDQLVDSLDANIQWQEYKHSALNELLRKRQQDFRR